MCLKPVRPCRRIADAAKQGRRAQVSSAQEAVARQSSEQGGAVQQRERRPERSNLSAPRGSGQPQDVAAGPQGLPHQPTAEPRPGLYAPEHGAFQPPDESLRDGGTYRRATFGRRPSGKPAVLVAAATTSTRIQRPFTTGDRGGTTTGGAVKPRCRMARDFRLDRGVLPFGEQHGERRAYDPNHGVDRLSTRIVRNITNERGPPWTRAERSLILVGGQAVE